MDILLPEGNPAITYESMLLDSRGIAIDNRGNLFISDTGNHVIRKYLANGTPLTVFGREQRFGHIVGDLNGDVSVCLCEYKSWFYNT